MRKDDNLGMPLQVGKCILKNKMANGYERMEGVGQLIREYCGNYFYLNSKILNKM